MTALPHSQTLMPHTADNGVVYYTFSLLDEVNGLRHGVSTRFGGVSEGEFNSMNLSFSRGDKPERVSENYRRFCAAVGVDAKRAVTAAQEHHTTLRTVTEADAGCGVWRDRPYRDVDGLLTVEPNLPLITHYADCVPLLFCDPVRRVIASSHAGWRGTVAGIGPQTVQRMCVEFACRPENILAAIGPSIGPCCFEVDEPVETEFRRLSVFDEGCVARRMGEKRYLNLWEINRRLLREAGIAENHLAVTDLCTRCQADTFWSHRATGGHRGGMATCISWIE